MTSFRQGDLTIHRIVEQVISFRPALELLDGLTPEVLAENRAWLQPHALDADDMLILSFHAYVVETPHHTIMVDTCIGNDKPRSGWTEWDMKHDDAFMRGLAGCGLKVTDIDAVMCTHLHIDHVGWNTRLDNGRWVPTFPNARYIFGKQEFDYWSKRLEEAPNPVFEDSVLPVVEANKADNVQSDFAIGDHVRLLPTPGHTPGHLAICFGRGRDTAVMPGDLMHSPLQLRFPEFSANFDGDKAQAAQTRRSFLERYCDADTVCCSGHFPSPSVGRIARWGNGFGCEDITS